MEKANVKTPVHNLKLVAIVAAVLSIVFLVALDEVIIATAVPQIANDFKSLDEIDWYGSAYLFSSAALRLPFGKLFSIMAPKSIFLVSGMIFEIGSLLCAVAPTSGFLILGRIIAGVGASGIAIGSTVILARLVSLEKQALLVTIRTLTYGVANHTGPLFGGFLTTKFSWRWCFYINIPFGFVSLLIIAFILECPSPGTEQEKPGLRRIYQQIDIAGTLCFIIAVVSFLCLLQVHDSVEEGRQSSVVLLLSISMVFAAAFIHLQIQRKDNATIPIRIVRQHSILFGMLYQFFSGATTIVFDYYLPLWFQTVQGKTPLQSGTLILPMVMGYYTFTSLTNFGANQIGSTLPFLVLSGPVMALAAAMLTTLTVQPNHSLWFWAEIVFGAGAGTGLGKVTLAAISSLDQRDMPCGTALVAFTRALGSSISITLAHSIFKRRLDVLAARESGDVGSPGELMMALGATNKIFDLSHVEEHRKMYNDAITRMFHLPCVTALLSLVSSLALTLPSVYK